MVLKSYRELGFGYAMANYGFTYPDPDSDPNADLDLDLGLGLGLAVEFTSRVSVKLTAIGTELVIFSLQVPWTIHPLRIRFRFAIKLNSFG